MKKLLNASLLLAVCGIALFLGCKKDTFKEEKELTESATPVAENSVYEHSYGFLIFDTYDEFENYLEVMKSSTHASFKDYIDAEGFAIDFDKYGEEYNDEPITDEQMVDYIINEDSLVQIEGTVFRPTHNISYLITMHESELNGATFEFLKDGYFDIDKMNRFVTVPEDERGQFDFFEFLNETPNGHDENNVLAQRRVCADTPGEKCPGIRMFGQSCDPYVIQGHTDADGTQHGPHTEYYCCRHTFFIQHTCRWKDNP